MNDTTRYVIVTPVRDEAPYIAETIRAVVSQTRRPGEWVIVDDGSTDGTGEILDEHATATRWLRVVHRRNRGYRAAGRGVMEAFHVGRGALTDDRWDFIVKLDGDLTFEPDYFERCFETFDAEPRLGIGGGTVCCSRHGALVVDSRGDPPFHVRGATKIYRRACWEDIEPLATAPGWDTIDEVRANLYGWATRTFAELHVVQLKPTGSADGALRTWFKNGRANYLTGYHPLFMLAKCVKRSRHSPVLLASLALLTGFCSGYVKRLPKAMDEEAIQYLRRQQLRRLLRRPSIYG